ncbi:hypothetical protein A2Z33_00865 [Candidatus Gottesmanbacteria bacterium RBG_16_52_11]|uniref:DUF192 domain-containing protein n=1 Tax=Candidatus Gottesmanbacteria bacterium RBG_16_52_11 TaxID=1798374 RepID=A0A1F5YP07_9BACT|nr:MAG: hypothetical protein A2Z33_00865 [Candidatus Gottesmanbacteria bacterium RBG_16_52_11]
MYYYIYPPGAKVILNGQEIRVETAITGQEKQKGLSGRTSLAGDRGMIFLFDHAEKYEFWMQGMLIPLDFIWIKGNTVTDIHENVLAQTDTPPAVVEPDEAADKVLEVAAGTVQRTGIRIGDRVEFKQ